MPDGLLRARQPAARPSDAHRHLGSLPAWPSYGLPPGFHLRDRRPDSYEPAAAESQAEPVRILAAS